MRSTKPPTAGVPLARRPLPVLSRVLFCYHQDPSPVIIIVLLSSFFLQLSSVFSCYPVYCQAPGRSYRLSSFRDQTVGRTSLAKYSPLGVSSAEPARVVPSQRHYFPVQWMCLTAKEGQLQLRSYLYQNLTFPNRCI